MWRESDIYTKLYMLLLCRPPGIQLWGLEICSSISYSQDTWIQTYYNSHVKSTDQSYSAIVTVALSIDRAEYNKCSAHFIKGIL